MPTKKRLTTKVEGRTSKNQNSSSSFSFSKFLQDPMIAGALLVFAFVALMFSLNEFVAARGF